MTTELVLLLSIYSFVVLGVFLGDMGPIRVFERSAPRLAAKIERNISVGTEFSRKGQSGNIPDWQPESR